MSHFLKTLSFAALVALSGPALAQDDETAGSQETGETAAPATSDASTPEAGELDMGTPTDGDTAETEAEEAQNGPGSTYIGGEFGDWQQRCTRLAEGEDRCQLYQLLEDGNGTSVAEISVFPLPAGNQAAAGATIVTPLETLLPAGITLSVDGNEARRYPFEFCAQQGCIARVGFTDAEVNQFKRGAASTMIIRPAAAPDQEITLTVSLSGFTAGYEAIAEAQ